ncbi:MAG TPA: hypothetical protein K8V56_10680 [Sporosarcina psychrophila]|uniref:Uncharacterized protein n=1 Tax=Sporosarcina psychrophila TaxID=1476 RepID=A0A921FYV7_SPOPS|nr:hypothetical protein [Sporosarcina psychrophila]
MQNIQRIELETKGIQLSQQELIVYLNENGLSPHESYQADSLVSQKAIHQTALSILESIANNPENFKNIKMDDMSVENFSESIHRRINYLTRKIRSMKTDVKNTDVFMFYL